jgi:hypothetical protein
MNTDSVVQGHDLNFESIQRGGGGRENRAWPAPCSLASPACLRLRPLGRHVPREGAATRADRRLHAASCQGGGMTRVASGRLGGASHAPSSGDHRLRWKAGPCAPPLAGEANYLWFNFIVSNMYHSKLSMLIRIFLFARSNTQSRS